MLLNQREVCIEKILVKLFFGKNERDQYSPISGPIKLVQ